jgi:hypothetical protein
MRPTRIAPGLLEILTMITVCVNELTGAALDWAVTKIEAERKLFTIYPQYITPYSTDWAQGGPIIEREKLSVGTRYTNDQIYHDTDVLFWARNAIGGFLKYGPTPLIAAMRCYVASKLGENIDIPDELYND